MDAPERRKSKRFGARFDISCVEAGSVNEQFQTDNTVNVCTGGLYLETSIGKFKQGSLLKVYLSIPPTSGLLEFGGKISGFARVLRTDVLCDLPRGGHEISGKHGVAIEFCRPPKLCI